MNFLHRVSLMTSLALATFSVATAADSQPKESSGDREQLAFPGAEGFGRFAQGGRGGDVYHVTNLDDQGAGSLRDAVLTAKGPRTIVFDVSGTIRLKTRLEITNSYLTIAGQTSPGEGITLRENSLYIKDANHIIVRYIRIRLGDQNDQHKAMDAITTDDVDHLIFDHITASWGIDGNHDLRRGSHFTLQWSIYAEALNKSVHEKGEHAMLSSFRDLTGSISLHHNLFASSRDRHPSLGSSSKTKPDAVVDFRNNVIFNVTGTTNVGNCHINFINNFYRAGLDTPKNHQPIAAKSGKDGAKLQLFMRGNFFEDQPAFTANNYAAIDFERWSKGGYARSILDEIRVNREFEIGDARPHTDTAQIAFEKVLSSAGASLRRDAADARIVQGVRDKTNRLIDSQQQVGGWPALKAGQALSDADRDGMPDEWERRRSLNPADPNDGNGDHNHDGFTNLEEYLNSLVR